MEILLELFFPRVYRVFNISQHELEQRWFAILTGSSKTFALVPSKFKGVYIYTKHILGI